MCCVFSGTHEKLVLEAGILEKLIDTVVEMTEKDEENVSVKCVYNYDYDESISHFVMGCSQKTWF